MRYVTRLKFQRLDLCMAVVDTQLKALPLSRDLGCMQLGLGNVSMCTVEPISTQKPTQVVRRAIESGCNSEGFPKWRITFSFRTDIVGRRFNEINRCGILGLSPRGGLIQIFLLCQANLRIRTLTSSGFLFLSCGNCVSFTPNVLVAFATSPIFGIGDCERGSRVLGLVLQVKEGGKENCVVQDLPLISLPLLYISCPHGLISTCFPQETSFKLEHSDTGKH